MPYKRQHFIPKFYLKNFSIDDEQKSIALYNHRISKYVPKAQIKGQAYKEHIYGQEDEIEKTISKFESEISKLFSNPITKINPPDNIRDFNLLREFVFVQIFRTQKAGKEMMEKLNQGVKTIFPYLQLNQQLPEGGKLVHKYPSLVTLLGSLDKLHLMNYLDIRSIVNLSHLPFITSDHPVILYNQWMESKGQYLGATGIAIKGLQIFLPIHPRLMYCFYDPEIYTFSNPNSGSIAVESEEIIHQFNILQYLFSDEQLFFNGVLLEPYFEMLINKYAYLQKQPRGISKIVVNESSDNNRVQFLSLVSDPHINLQLPFLSLTEKANNTELKDGFPELRHPSFEKEDFLKKNVNYDTE